MAARRASREESTPPRPTAIVTTAGGVWRRAFRRRAGSKPRETTVVRSGGTPPMRCGPPRLSSWRESALAGPIDHRGSAGSLHWRRCLCAPCWYRRQYASVADWAASRAASRVDESSRFIDFAEDSLSDYEVHGGRDARIFTSALIVQPDLDRSARRDRRVSRILYFSRGAGLADYRSRRTATYSAHARSNRRSPQR